MGNSFGKIGPGIKLHPQGSTPINLADGDIWYESGFKFREGGVTTSLGGGTTSFITNWTAYTPTFTGFGTVSTSQFYYRRMGQNCQIRGSFTSGTPSATLASITLPSGLTISTDIRSGSTYDLVGVAELNQSIAYKLDVIARASETVVVLDRTDGSSPGLSGNTGNDLIASGQIVSLFCEVPISGWDANVPVVANIEWTPYTPTFTGLGTVTSINMKYRVIGKTLYVQGTFITGSATGTEARMSFPGSYVSATSLGVSGVPILAGMATSALSTSAGEFHFTVLCEQNVSYFTFGCQTATVGGLVKRNGNAFGNASESRGIVASVEIQ